MNQLMLFFCLLDCHIKHNLFRLSLSVSSILNTLSSNNSIRKPFPALTPTRLANYRAMTNNSAAWQGLDRLP